MSSVKSASSSSSIPELIRDHMQQTHVISEKGYDQSSILECLQSKVDELLKYKEQFIALESQLKIAQETNKLQSAEFAFRQSQLQEEIDQMKAREKDLAEQISKREQEIIAKQKYDVDVKLEESNAVKAKYEKWKSRGKALKSDLKKAEDEKGSLMETNASQQEQIESLEKKVQVLEQEVKEATQVSAHDDQAREELQKARDELASKIEEMEKKVEKEKSRAQRYKEELQENSEFHQKTEQLEMEKQELENQLKKANAKLIKQQVQLRNLANEKSQVELSSHENQSMLEQERADLKAKTRMLAKQLEKMQGIEEVMKSQKDALYHVELERDKIADLLGVDAGRITDQWTTMNKKIEEMISDIERLRRVETENEKLQRRLNAALEDSRKKTSNVQNLAGNGEYTAMLEYDLKQARMELERHSSKMQQLRLQQKFSDLIEQINSNISRQITDLHSSICGTNNSSAKPLILAIIFARRFLNIHAFEVSQDAESLQAFSGRENLSIEAQVNEIRKHFVTLTQDLVVTKQSLVDTNTNLANTTEERDIAQLSLRANSDEMKLNTKKMSYVKQRMEELQDELSSLVSPENYTDMCRRLDSVQNQCKAYETQVKQLQFEIDKRTSLERSMASEIETLKATTEQRTELAEELRAKCYEKDEEIESMKALVRDKTKEVLQLERLVKRHQDRESSTSVRLNCLAVENQALQQNKLIFTDTDKADPGFPAVTVNPAFLGV